MDARLAHLARDDSLFYRREILSSAFRIRYATLIPYLLQGITLGFSAAVQPGPFQAYLLTQATTYGWKKTLPAAFAPLISDGPIIFTVLLLLSQAPAWFLRGLSIAGGIFLLYLAYGAFRTFQTFRGEQNAKVSEHNIFKAALMNLLSPNPWLFWTVLGGPLLVRAWQESPVNAIAFLLSFYVLLIGGNVLLIFALSSARRLGPQSTRALNGIAAAALVLFGVMQIWRGAVGA